MKVFLLVVAFSAVLAADIDSEEGVLVLKSSNFQQAITDNEFILVEFYAPWCGHCKALKPEYEKAAKALAADGSKIVLAKVDATEEADLASQFDVRGYPTLKFFKNQKAQEYNGGRVSEEIVSWLKKKTGPPAKTLASADEVKDFQAKNEVVVIGAFSDEKSAEAQAYLKAAGEFDDILFGIITDAAVWGAADIKAESVSLFKTFDEGRVDFTETLESDALVTFVKSNMLPLVVEFSHKTAQKIFGGDVKEHVLLFFSEQDAKTKAMKDAASTVAKEFKGKIMFVTINTDEEEHVRILEFFGMSTEDVPALRIIQLKEDMAKYKPASADITEDSIRSFVTEYLAGNLKQHLLSQTLPDDWNKLPVWVLVSTNFDSVAFDNSKDVLVEFYAPWCGHCKQLAPIYDQLGEKYQAKDDVVIAKMDATANELEHTKIQSFPTIKLYKKEGDVVDYDGARTLDSMALFIDSRGAKSEAVQEDEEENEEDVPSKDEL